MIRMIKHLIVLSFVVTLVYCGLYVLILLPRFAGDTSVFTVKNDQINQASGLAMSWDNPGILWTHNDKTLGNVLFALDEAGNTRGQFIIDKSVWDCEDIAVGPGPDLNLSYIYLADIGDNDRRRNVCSIIRFPEPHLNPNTDIATDTLHHFDTIRFSFPDGSRDAETLLLDPSTRDLFVISKRDANARIYRIPYPQNTVEINTAELVSSIRMTMVVSGDISMDGHNILLKTYGSVYYWSRFTGEKLQDVFKREGTRLLYYPEPQGEAICWEQYQTGYYTLSEELLGIECQLVRYEFTDSKRQHPLTSANLQLGQRKITTHTDIHFSHAAQ